MPRLGVPANIVRVVGEFRQPGPRLNPLGLVLRVPLTVYAERATGARLWCSWWSGYPVNADVPFPLRKQALIPLLDAVIGEFCEQVTPWRAFDVQKREQVLIIEEIRRQLGEYDRRPKRRGLGRSKKRVRQRTFCGMAG